MVPQGRHLDFKFLAQVSETFLVLLEAIEDKPQGSPSNKAGQADRGPLSRPGQMGQGMVQPKRVSRKNVLK